VTINLGDTNLYKFFHVSRQTSNLQAWPLTESTMLRKQYNKITIKVLNYLDYILFFYDSSLLRCLFICREQNWFVFMMWYPKMKSFVLVLLCFISSRHVQNN
jgi:hypothetical protein